LSEVAGNEDGFTSLKIARAVIVSEAIASSSSEQFAIRWADITVWQRSYLNSSVEFSRLAWYCNCLTSFVELIVLNDTRICVECTNTSLMNSAKGFLLLQCAHALLVVDYTVQITDHR